MEIHLESIQVAYAVLSNSQLRDACNTGGMPAVRALKEALDARESAPVRQVTLVSWRLLELFHFGGMRATLYDFFKLKFPFAGFKDLKVCAEALAMALPGQVVRLQWNNLGPAGEAWWKPLYPSGSATDREVFFFDGTHPLLLPDLRQKGLLPSDGAMSSRYGPSVYAYATRHMPFFARSRLSSPAEHDAFMQDLPMLSGFFGYQGSNRTSKFKLIPGCKPVLKK